MEYSFQWFKDAVKSKDGIWQGGNVRFMQFMDGYGATCLSEELDGSKKWYGLTYNTDFNIWRNISPDPLVSEEFPVVVNFT